MTDQPAEDLEEALEAVSRRLQVGGPPIPPPTRGPADEVSTSQESCTAETPSKMSKEVSQPVSNVPYHPAKLRALQIIAEFKMPRHVLRELRSFVDQGIITKAWVYKQSSEAKRAQWCRPIVAYFRRLSRASPPMSSRASVAGSGMASGGVPSPQWLRTSL